MINYLKIALLFLIYTVGGALAGIVGGYICGAVGGLILTAYNNNILTETAPQGSYLWWANFGGYLLAVFAVLPGAAAGFITCLARVLIKRNNNKLHSENSNDKI